MVDPSRQFARPLMREQFIISLPWPDDRTPSSLSKGQNDDADPQLGWEGNGHGQRIKPSLNEFIALQMRDSPTLRGLFLPL
jgi:hypothetical protein